jgi:predicted DNA-binding transcriptional regulator YafY
MGRGTQLEKLARIERIREILLDHEGGLTAGELLDRLQTDGLQLNRTTLWRDLNEMTAYVDQSDGRYVVDRTRCPVPVEFRLDEAMALYLAARLLVDGTDRRYPAAAHALLKLGRAVQTTAPLIGEQVRRTGEVMESSARREDPHFIANLQQITTAWAQRRMVRLHYRKNPQERLKTHEVAPYFIEPSAVGQCSYLGGRREPPGELRTYKIERIERVEVLDRRYELPPDFDLAEHLKHAWGIWTTDGEPVEVALRFVPQAAARVRESRWHPSERLEPQPDGSLVWRAWVAETTEMLYWIKGWGALVEVLAPAELRAILAQEARRLAEVYAAAPRD